MRNFQRYLFRAALVSMSACAAGPGAGSSPGTKPEPTALQSSTDRMIAALTPTRLAPSDATRSIDAAIASHFQRAATRRAYLMTDKPLYQPGESIWFRADLRATGSLIGAAPTGLTIQLVSPRGAIAMQRRLLATDGVAQNDFALPAELEGGEYTLQLAADDGTTDSKKIIVNTYEAPRLMKTVELLRKAYGEGDPVAAAIELKRATGEPFAGKPVTAIVTVDDAEVARLPIKTDADGKATVKFQLPSHIARGDGLVTILADDGGVAESIQKRIPILLKTMQLQLFPEGGDLIDGLPGRVYVQAKTMIGKPADIEGKIVDDRGQVVASFSTIHDGLGRFDVTPMTDRSYHVEVTRPAGIAQKFALPAAKPGGCVLRSVPARSADRLQVAATCTTARSLLVEAVQRETKLASGAAEVTAGAPALLELPVDPAMQGAVRVTLFSTKNEPLAERLIYHGRGQDLKVTLTADKKTYSPRDPVKLTVRTSDASGKPVKASVGVAVVDGTVLSFADDKSAGILAHLYLEPELGAPAQLAADPIEEPNYYFSDKPEAPAAMDALLATRGYRRFEWQPVFAPPVPVATERYQEVMADAAPAPEPELARPRGAMPAKRPMAVPAPPPAAAPAPAIVAHKAKKLERKEAENRIVKVAGAAQAQPVAKADDWGGGRADAKRVEAKPMRQAAMRRQRLDKDMAGDEMEDDRIVAWAPVRVFPVPTYSKSYSGPRTDFRETIYWNGNVQTSADGTAQVTFPVSDAITSFRATAEGVSAGGVPGAGSITLQSKLPLTLDAKLPLEVTSGDEIRLPVTLSNETDDGLDAELDAKFGAAFRLIQNPVAGKIHLAAGEKKSLFFPLRVVATEGSGDVALTMTTLGMKDELAKKIRVVPLGFPFEVSTSGSAKRGAPSHHEVELAGALPGSIRATVTMYPSPLASMTKGMEAMIAEPGGCFEQTSSTNYPNIMILGYLGANDAADPALIARTQGVLDKGYKLLTGYETKQKGYEWFGQSPGHEALTAYGLMEFADMAKVYDVDPHMVERTADWLMSRRDHKGGFARSGAAIDSFGRANPTTTNAYIMWALAEAKRTGGLDAELAAQKAIGRDTRDPYLLALATNTALVTAPAAADTAGLVQKLVGLQAKDGSFPGAKESITMSGGQALTVEATSLATLAMIKASPRSELEPQLRQAVAWINTQRSGAGQFGNTQATILALKALTAYTEHARQMPSGGTATLIVNGAPAGTITFDKGRRDALVWDDLAGKLAPGHNTIELVLDGDAQLPYTIAIEYRSAQPQSSKAAKIAVTTTIDKPAVKLGEGVVLRAHVENVTAGGVPMTLARIGIPGGLVAQTWQLKELRDKGLVDFYETRPREVILYWRQFAPSATKDIALDLLASVPGVYAAPASSAYLYYTAEDKAWAPSLQVTIQ